MPAIRWRRCVQTEIHCTNYLQILYHFFARSLLVQFLLETILSTDEKNILSLAEALCICSQIERRIFFWRIQYTWNPLTRRSTEHYLQILHHFFARIFLYKFSADSIAFLVPPSSFPIPRLDRDPFLFISQFQMLIEIRCGFVLSSRLIPTPDPQKICKNEFNKPQKGGNRGWTGDLSDCSRLLYHWAIPPQQIGLLDACNRKSTLFILYFEGLNSRNFFFQWRNIFRGKCEYLSGDGKDTSQELCPSGRNYTVRSKMSCFVKFVK